MRKLIASARKEILLLTRDWGGLGILFLMPSLLLITITLIQESTFKAVGESVIPVVLVDNDGGDIGKTIMENLSRSESTEVVSEWKNQPIDDEKARELVSDGKYQIALVIPENLSSDLEERINTNVEKILAEFSMEEPDSSKMQTESEEIKKVKIYFDPAAGQAFRNSVKNNIEKMLSKVESQKIYKTFQDQMGIGSDNQLLQGNAIDFDEIIAQKGEDAIIPNAVQHNVPAWILFGIFFIVVPLGINIVKEKNLGTYIRIRTSPVSYATILGGKILTYVAICFIQFLLMLLIARFIFPCLGLIPFKTGNHLALMLIVVLFSALAAIGLGILIGTVCKTQEQSAPFGAIFTIILAAIGGIWVPTFVMPEFMQQLSVVSPMNWGISSFYDIILRNGSLKDISPELTYLFLFFLVTLLLSLLINRKNSWI